ncbi:lysine--tRNA ligase, partial [candidate division WWE3 bacterium]|nr:lysine--tRNA ligase [candidate division WWE3 bacterium]
MTSRDLIKARLEKLIKIKESGVDPYPSVTIKKSEIAGFQKAGLDQQVSTAGRLHSVRDHGKITFADLVDESGKIQLAFKKDVLGKEKYDFLGLLDFGDFISVDGKLFKTKAGEQTIEVSNYQMLTKSLRPFPSEWFGFKDVEERFRQRYVDFNLNPGLRDLFKKKARFWGAVRSFMRSRGFLEVETPVLENTAGGADANPFSTHHNALDLNVFLRISAGELWQKRLMVGGFEKTFEIGRIFRNEGMSKEHLQDYTQMEFYWAYANYKDSMKLVEELYKYIALETFGTYEFEIGDFKVNLGQKWGELNYSEALRKEYAIDVSAVSDEVLKEILTQKKVGFSKADAKGRLVDLLWKDIRKKVAGPVFLVDHPVEVSPLAKRKQDNPNLTERYQPIIAGSEMGNGYTELNDPI